MPSTIGVASELGSRHRKQTGHGHARYAAQSNRKGATEQPSGNASLDFPQLRTTSKEEHIDRNHASPHGIRSLKIPNRATYYHAYRIGGTIYGQQQE
jgi:hypothetical protein